MFSTWGLASGDREGTMMVRFLGILEGLSVLCHPARSISISNRLVLGRAAMWAASVRGKFFERLDDPRLLSGVLRTPADVRRRIQRRQQIGDGPLAVNHLFQSVHSMTRFTVDTSPANHAVHLWIGAGFHDRREFAHLFLRQEPGTARTGNGVSGHLALRH